MDAIRRTLVSGLVVSGVSAQSLAQTPDSLKPPISPRRAFLTSALVPGLGQAALNRSTGLIFAGVEALALAMYGKTRHDLAVARSFASDSAPLTYVIDPGTGVVQRDSTGALMVATWSTSRFNDARVRARRSHVEDVAAVIIFNHLFSGIDAFVAAQLWKLPAQVRMRALPNGIGVNARIRW
jgi:hypothetical protein